MANVSGNAAILHVLTEVAVGRLMIGSVKNLNTCATNLVL